jgi:hypothetical protein
MNSIHRVGLAVAALVTALAVVGAFVVDGYASVMASQNQATPEPATQTTAESPSGGSPAPVIIYVLPEPTATPTPTIAPLVDIGLPQAESTISPYPTSAAAQTPAPNRTPRPTRSGGDD